MSLLIRFLRAYNKPGWRGAYRLTSFLADRIESLQSLPIQTEWGTVYADLRISSSRGILVYPRSLTGEDLVMKRFVKEGDVVFDIGAHLGFYTTLLSKLVGATGKVFAFEPNSALFPSLKKTLSSFKNLELFEIALSDKKGTISLFVPEDASMASLSDWTAGAAGTVQTSPCEMDTIDHLVRIGRLRLPQFIKCDVEGAELSVFSGATETLDRDDAPVILFEVNKKAANSFGVEVADYFTLLESLERPKYRFFEVLPERLDGLLRRDIEFANIVAVPDSRIE